MKKLIPCHSGTFEVFDFVDENNKSQRYVRHQFKFGYIWYKFDFFTELYQSLENETQLGVSDDELEEYYARYSQSKYIHT
jgi:hypothetical protein